MFKYDIIRLLRTNYLSLIALAIMYVVVFMFSINTVWVGDDVAYGYVFEDVSPNYLDDPVPINSLGDIVTSQFNHYMIYNGRVVAHVLVQLFCGILGHGWFAVCNGLAYAAFILALMRLCGATLRSTGSLVSILIMIVLVFQTHMVPSIQIGFIWMGAVVLWFMYLFAHCDKVSGLRLAALAVAGLIAGNAQDAYCVGVALALAAHFVHSRGRLSPGQWALTVGFTIGCAFLCLSPGIINRAVTEEFDLTALAVTWAVSLKCLLMLVAILAYKRARRELSLREVYRSNRTVCNTLIGCLVFNILIHVPINRSLFGVELMSIILIIRVLRAPRFTLWWQCALGALAVTYVAHQAVITRIHDREMATIGQQCDVIADSDDRRVYVDLYDKWFSGNYDYSPRLYYYERGEYFTLALQRLIARSHTGCDGVILLPSCLEGKDSVDVGNVYMPLTGSHRTGVYIQSKAHPGHFYVKRKLLGLIDLPPLEIDFSTPLYESGHWRAVVKKEPLPYVVYGDVSIHDCPLH